MQWRLQCSPVTTTRVVTEALIRRINCRASLRQATAGRRLSLAAYVTMTFDLPIPSVKGDSVRSGPTYHVGMRIDMTMHSDNIRPKRTSDGPWL
ncbi:hypothetical protein CFB82_33180 [Burkholderia sp. HI2714]|nr:hypothetical protein CFB82_33180 [Burkholderia sp. HI2714]